MPQASHTRSHPYFKLRRLTPHFQIGPEAAAPWSVPNLCAAYNWPKGLAGGGVIAIVELGGGWVQSDMDQYFKRDRAASSADHGCFGGWNTEQSQPEHRFGKRSGLRGCTRHPGCSGCVFHGHRKNGDDPDVLVAGHRNGGAESRQRRLRCVLNFVGRR